MKAFVSAFGNAILELKETLVKESRVLYGYKFD